MADVGVLWDIDDTLFDYSGAERAGILEHLAGLGLLGEFASPEQAHALWNADMEAAYERFLAGELGFQEQRRVRVEAFLGRIGRVAPDPDIPPAFGREVPPGSPVTWTPSRATAASSTTWYRHWTPCRATGTGCSPTPPAATRRTNWRRSVCAAASPRSSARTRSASPSPRPRPSWPAAPRSACRPWGHLPAEGWGSVVYVGDKLTTDAEGALAAGLHAFWLDRRGLGDGAGVPRIDTLADLPELLRLIDFGAPPTIR